MVMNRISPFHLLTVASVIPTRETNILALLELVAISKDQT